MQVWSDKATLVGGGSMSKIIDVEAGDTFAIETITGQVTQRRGERERVVDGTAVRDWLKASAPWSVTVPLSPRTADATFRHWGYSITTPAAKDESPAKTEPAPSDLAATVKRVEERVNDLTKIVHGLQNSMPGYDKDVMVDEAVRRLDERLSKLEAATTPVPLWKSVNAKTGLTDEEEREAIALAKSLRAERDTPAKVLVVAPGMAQGGHGPANEGESLYNLGASHQDTRWRKALSAAGVEVKEASK